ncbi:MAG TPA: hypothetical protein VF598_13825 [Hymenobacter sp.]
MKKELQYTVYCQLTLAELEDGRVVRTRQVDHRIPSPTAELNEIFAELYEQFRSPFLLGRQITSIQYQNPSIVQVLQRLTSRNTPKVPAAVARIG